MVLSLAVALAVAAGPTFSGAATVGVSLTTGDQSSNVAPVVAVRLGVTQVTPVGIVRGRVATLVPFQPTTVLSSDLGTALEFERPFVGGGSWRIRFEPFNPSMRLVTFDWANVLGRVFPAVTGFSPVLSADLQLGAFEGFVALRSTARFDQATGRGAAYLDVLAGAKVTTGDVAIEARVTRLGYGPQPVLALQGSSEEQWGLIGASRLTWSRSGGVEAPLDLVTYAADPRRFERFFQPVDLGPKAFAATVSLEAGGGVQRLASPASFRTMTLQPLAYADAQGRLRFGQTRLFATLRVSTFAFLQADSPGFPQNFALGDVPSTPALAAFLGADHTFARSKVTPGVLLRLTMPATLNSPSLDFGGNAPPPGLIGRTVALEGLNFLSALPAGAVISPRFAAKVSLRWTPAAVFCLVGEAEVLVNPSETGFDNMGTPLTARLAVSTRTQLFAQLRF